jgi:branched-chain amino acid transport system substrate-binding protein
VIGTRRKVFSVVCAVAIAALLAACGSSSKKSTSTTTAPVGSAGSASGAPASSAPSAQATGAAIKVGFICTCSGVLGTFNAPLIDVFRAWADTVNASGGIDGHNVDVVYENDAGVPGTSETEVQTLIADHVVAITDSSVVDQPWASTVQAANIPVVGMGQTSDSTFDTNPDFYPAGQTFSSQMYAITAEAKAAGASNIGDIYCAEAPACQQTVSLIKTAGQQLGVPEVYKAAISSTAPNYTAQCVAANQQHLTSFFVADAVTVLDEVAHDCATQGFNPIYPWGLTAETRAEMNAPDFQHGLWMESGNYPYFAQSPAIKAINAGVDKYYPGLAESTTQWFENSVTTWASGMLLADAIKAGGLTSGDAPSAAEVVKGLESLKGDTLDGLSAPLTFAAGQPHVVNCWFMTRAQNGQPTLLNNGAPTCENGASS